jgi:hypothetical protein
MASWITSSHKIDTDSFPEKYVDLTQKMYSFYKEMGCSDIIEKSKVGDEFYPTRDFEEDSVVRQFIDEFEEDTFWAELVIQLAISSNSTNERYSFLVKLIFIGFIHFL